MKICKSTALIGVISVAGLAVGSAPVRANSFNGVEDNGTGDYGYYYEVGGGLFPNGQTRDASSGGTIQFITDSNAWYGGYYGLDQWHKDGWYPVTSSIALTMWNSNQVVFDNNGIETGNVPSGFYNYPVNGSLGVVVGYSMSNNWDWIYAGYFHLNAATTIDQITGYFLVSNDPNSPAAGFNPNDPHIMFHSNIFSQDTNEFAKNTGSFAGDVFSSDTVLGTFSWSDTNMDRVGSSSSSDIYRLNYALNEPVVLPAGDYYFSTDASIVPVPLPSSVGVGLAMLVGFGGAFALRTKLAKRVRIA